MTKQDIIQLNNLLIENNTNKKELSELLGHKSPSSMSRLFNDRNDITLNTLRKIGKVFGKKLVWSFQDQ